MKISYKEHYENLIKEHGDEIGLIQYKKFLRSSTLETCIIKFGLEEGTKKFNSKNKPGTSLERMIEKYGDIDGNIKFENWKNSTKQNKENFIIRYGEEIGKKKFDEFRLNCVVKDKIKNDKNSNYNNRIHNTKIEYYLEICDGDYNKAKQLLSERQNTSSLDKFIKKYGEVVGKEKYLNTNRIKSVTLDNFIRLYGDIEGSERWENYKNKLTYSHSINYYIDKYGEIDGKKIWIDIQKSKFHNFNSRSKISDEFCLKLFNLLKKFNLQKIYFSENEYMFFIHDDEFKIIMPDFFIKDFNIIVEFYGDYWHRNPKIYTDDISECIRIKDNKRIQKLKDNGNEIIVVWETDYLKDKNKTLIEVFDKIQKIIQINGNSKFKKC